MKYLRHINEGNKVNDVEDFIKDHLAYLFDDQTFVICRCVSCVPFLIYGYRIGVPKGFVGEHPIVR